MQFKNWRTPENSTTVAAARTAGATTLVVKTGDGVKFGSPSGSAPLPLLVLRQSDQPNQGVALLATGVATDTVTVSVPTGPDAETYPDANLSVGDLVLIGQPTPSYLLSLAQA